MENKRIAYKHTSPDERGRVAQSITIFLTVAGLLLLVFVGSKAVGKASGMEYVEGKRYRQNRTNSFIASARPGLTHQPGEIVNTIQPPSTGNLVNPELDSKVADQEKSKNIEHEELKPEKYSRQNKDKQRH